MKIELISCTLEHVHALQDISRETFQHTFGNQNTPENMAAYMEKAFRLEQLSTELSHPESRFFFAYVDGELAGYVKVNTGAAQTEQMGADALEVERIYVRHAYQGQKIGTYLLEHALHLAATEQRNPIWLGVWEHNRKAIAFYEKMGFVQTAVHSFYMGDEEQFDWIMSKTL
ncbi:GNAT family N-acetyltransferase [Paenibacillus wenxiniae]|uniref:GNAT family N-acetyltransferase n=1 Tax=Paenibacillus wenxiniae TaxID=1636843 RepID=A0ABW4RIZ3_9BACL